MSRHVSPTDSGAPPEPPIPRRAPPSESEILKATDTVRALHHLRRRIVWSLSNALERLPHGKYALLGLPSSLGRCLSAPFRALYSLALSGGEVRRSHGVGLVRQYVDILKVTWRLGLRPSEYYLYSLFRPEEMRKAPFIIGTIHNAEILVALLGSERPTLGKVDFHRACVDNGLPTVPILAVCRAGMRPEIRDDTDPAWEGDVFSKPAFGSQGRDCRLWRRQDGGGWRDRGVRVRSREELLAFLGSEARSNDPRLVQPRRLTHPDMAGLTTGALSTVRYVTVRDPHSGRVEHIFARARIPVREAWVDNEQQGSLGAAIDLDTGRLGRGWALTPGGLGPRYDTHPDTGRRVTGCQLPFWDEVRALVTRAQEVFPYPSLGWDVGIGHDGPFLVEGNTLWGANLIQVVNDLPLGLTPYARIMVEYLRAEATRRRLRRMRRVRGWPLWGRGRA
ncbi:MAG TPA: sugar-transfer associated ATP-grasp domain-containing protein [Longimicrobiales bacterium]